VTLASCVRQQCGTVLQSFVRISHPNWIASVAASGGLPARGALLDVEDEKIFQLPEVTFTCSQWYACRYDHC